MKNIDWKEFFRKNMSLYHIIGIVIGVTLSVLYWYEKGQFTDNILKNSLFLMITWGILVGYVTMDLVKNANEKRNKE